MVYSIALRLLGDHGFAEEVAQDCFVELYRSQDRIEAGDHARFWLRRVAVHRATDALRRRAIRPESGAAEWDEVKEWATLANTGRARSASAMEVRMEHMLMTLPEAMRVALVLRFQEDMRPEEISALLEQPVATVKSHLQRGLGLLRRKANVMLKEFVRG